MNAPQQPSIYLPISSDGASEATRRGARGRLRCRKLLSLWLIFVLLLSGCHHGGGAVEVQTAERRDIPGGVAVASGAERWESIERAAAVRTLEWLDRTYGLVNDPSVVQYMAGLTNRLAGAVRGRALEPESGLALEDELINYPWQVWVIRSPEQNAYSIGGGIIIVTAGLIISSPTEAELATVIGHEMAHQLLGHTRAALEEVLEEQNESTDEDVPASASGVPRLSFSLERETEADSLGLRILQVAGYNIAYAPGTLLCMHRRNPENQLVPPPDWLEERSSRLYQHTAELAACLSGTTTSREFNVLRRRMIELL